MYTFNNLATVCLQNKNVSLLLAVKHLLRPGQLKVVEFIQKYMVEYGAIPTIEIVERALPGIYVNDKALEEAPKYIYDTILPQLQTNYLQDNWDGIVKNGLVEYSSLRTLMQNAEVPNLDILDFGEYDRSVHFENRTMRKIGISWFDNATGGGLDSSDFIVLFGRLKSGKTTVLLYLTFALLLQKYNIHFYSNELSKTQIAGRLDAFMQGFNPRLIRSGEIPDDIKESLIEFQKNNEYKKRLTIFGTVNNVEQVQANLNTSTDRPDVIIVDSANLMGKAVGDTGEKAVAMAEISRKFKLLALNEKVPVIATIQEKRSGSTNDRETGDASLIADSDAWGRDTDLAIRVSPVEQNGRNYIRNQVSASRHTEIIEDDYISVNYDTMTVSHHKLTEYGEDSLLEKKANAVNELLERVNERNSKNETKPKSVTTFSIESE